MKIVSLLLLCATGCAFGPGEPFGTLHPKIEAQLHLPAGRGNPGPLASDYVVYLTRFDVEFTEGKLVDLGDLSASAFDPASPPPGYTVCHGGHCDREDGALIPYEEVAASLPGGGGATEVAHLHVGAVNQLGETRALECEETCALPAGTVDSVKVGVARVFLEGEVHDGRFEKRFEGLRQFSFDLPFPEGAQLSGEVDLKLDRHSPPHVFMTLKPLLGPKVLDGVDFSQPIDTDAVRTQLIESVVTSPLDIQVERSNRSAP